MISLMQQQNVEEHNAPPLASPNITTPPPRFKFILLYITESPLLHISCQNLTTCSCVRSLEGKERSASEKSWQENDLVMALPTHPSHPFHLFHRILQRVADIQPTTPRQDLPDDNAVGPTGQESERDALEQVPEKVREGWRAALTQFANEFQAYPQNQSITTNPKLLSALPCYWPLVCMTLNAKSAINRFRCAAKCIFHNDAKLLGHTDASARTITQNQANNIELAAIRLLAHALARLFQPTTRSISLYHLCRQVGTASHSRILDNCSNQWNAPLQ